MMIHYYYTSVWWLFIMVSLGQTDLDLENEPCIDDSWWLAFGNHTRQWKTHCQTEVLTGKAPVNGPFSSHVWWHRRVPINKWWRRSSKPSKGLGWSRWSWRSLCPPWCPVPTADRCRFGSKGEHWWTMLNSKMDVIWMLYDVIWMLYGCYMDIILTLQCSHMLEHYDNYVQFTNYRYLHWLLDNMVLPWAICNSNNLLLNYSRHDCVAQAEIKKWFNGWMMLWILTKWSYLVVH